MITFEKVNVKSYVKMEVTLFLYKQYFPFLITKSRSSTKTMFILFERERFRISGSTNNKVKFGVACFHVCVEEGETRKKEKGFQL